MTFNVLIENKSFLVNFKRLFILESNYSSEVDTLKSYKLKAHLLVWLQIYRELKLLIQAATTNENIHNIHNYWQGQQQGKQVKFFMPSWNSPRDMTGPFKKIINLTLESVIIKID